MVPVCGQLQVCAIIRCCCASHLVLDAQATAGTQRRVWQVLDSFTTSCTELLCLPVRGSFCAENE